MKKNKIGIFALALGSLGFLSCLTSGEVKTSSLDNYLAKDTTFLVVLDGTQKSLGEDGVKASQDAYIKELKSLIGNNFTVTQRLDAINTLKIKANKNFESALNSIGGVTKVAINKTYRFSETSSSVDANNAEVRKEGYIPFEDANNTEGGETSTINQSKVSMEVPKSNNGGAGSFVAILDSGFYIQHNAFANFTDADVIAKAQARFNYSDLNAIEGLTATREKVLDESEADKATYVGTLNDKSLYYNLKIPFYYDYGGSSDNSANDYDVLSRISEHGTHVASITGANGTYEGIAPNAQLALMKVFYESLPSEDGTSSGGVYAKDEDILEALNDCALLGVDALNMSLGSDLDDFADTSGGMAALNKLAEDGIICNVAAGNSGKLLYKSMSVYKDWGTEQVDTGILGSYAVSGNADVIASSTNPTQYYDNALQFTLDDDSTYVAGYKDQVDYNDGSDGITKDKEKLLADFADKDGTIQLITAGVADSSGNYYGTDADYSTAQSVSGDSNLFKDKVVVCDRGSTTFVAKAQAAVDAGAKGLIVINNDPTAIELTFGMSWSNGDGYSVPEIPVVFVLYRDRETILSEVLKAATSESGTTYARTGSCKVIKESESDNPDKDQLSDFSSDGLASDLTISPKISAPGSSIKGATLGKAGSNGYVKELDPDSYEYMNGTSMATPNFTGAIALMIGEQEFATDEERIAYLKSLNMRTMSTATQYESTSTIYNKITTVVEKTTATKEEDREEKLTYQIKDGDSEENVAPYSPRKQGAGVVNVNKALKSKVYLEGLTVNDDGTFSENGNGNGKIELKNSKKIKNGTLSLGFRIHNSDALTATFKAKVKIMASEINSYHNHDNELANYVTYDAKYEGSKLQTPYDKVLEEVDLGTVTLDGSATQDVTLASHDLTAETKEYLANFENGTIVEGYLYLEPETEDLEHGITTLSVPYLGFYGDYDKAAPTQPFNFEREEIYQAPTELSDAGKEIGIEGANKVEGKLYSSDLVNSLGKNSYALSYIDSGSRIGVLGFETYNSTEKQSAIVSNKNNIGNFANDIVTKTEDDGKVTLYAGGADSDVLYIQEYVYRSLTSEVVRIIDSKNNIVLQSNVRDIINNTNKLYKSMISSNYISSYILNHRGYCELPLYNDDGSKIADGTYTLRFIYNTNYGSSITKEYNLVIDSNAPELLSKSIYTKNGSSYLRLKFSEIYIDDESKISVNANYTTFQATQIEDGFLVDIPLDSAYREGKLFVTITDACYNTYKFMLNEVQDNVEVGISSDALVYGTTYTSKRTVNSSDYNINDTFEISASDYRGNAVDLGTFTARFVYSKAFNASIKAYGIDENGDTHTLDSEIIDNNILVVTSNYTKIQIVDTGANSSKDLDDASINVTSNEGGTVIADRTSCASGEVVTLFIIPNDGYKVKEVTVNGTTIAADSNGNYSFTATSGTNAVVVTFEAK